MSNSPRAADERKQGTELWYNEKNKPGAEPQPKSWELTVDVRLCCNMQFKNDDTQALNVNLDSVATFLSWYGFMFYNTSY